MAEMEETGEMVVTGNFTVKDDLFNIKSSLYSDEKILGRPVNQKQKERILIE